MSTIARHFLSNRFPFPRIVGDSLAKPATAQATPIHLGILANFPCHHTIGLFSIRPPFLHALLFKGATR